MTNPSILHSEPTYDSKYEFNIPNSIRFKRNLWDEVSETREESNERENWFFQSHDHEYQNKRKLKKSRNKESEYNYSNKSNLYSNNLKSNPSPLNSKYSSKNSDSSKIGKENASYQKVFIQSSQKNVNKLTNDIACANHQTSKSNILKESKTVNSPKTQVSLKGTLKSANSSQNSPLTSPNKKRLMRKAKDLYPTSLTSPIRMEIKSPQKIQTTYEPLNINQKLNDPLINDLSIKSNMRDVTTEDLSKADLRQNREILSKQLLSNNLKNLYSSFNSNNATSFTDSSLKNEANQNLISIQNDRSEKLRQIKLKLDQEYPLPNYSPKSNNSSKSGLKEQFYQTSKMKAQDLFTNELKDSDFKLKENNYTYNSDPSYSSSINFSNITEIENMLNNLVNKYDTDLASTQQTSRHKIEAKFFSNNQKDKLQFGSWTHEVDNEYNHSNNKYNQRISTESILGENLSRKHVQNQQLQTSSIQSSIQNVNQNYIQIPKKNRKPNLTIEIEEDENEYCEVIEYPVIQENYQSKIIKNFNNVPITDNPKKIINETFDTTSSFTNPSIIQFKDSILSPEPSISPIIETFEQVIQSIENSHIGVEEIEKIRLNENDSLKSSTEKHLHTLERLQIENILQNDSSNFDASKSQFEPRLFTFVNDKFSNDDKIYLTSNQPSSKKYLSNLSLKVEDPSNNIFKRAMKSQLILSTTDSLTPKVNQSNANDSIPNQIQSMNTEYKEIKKIQDSTNNNCNSILNKISSSVEQFSTKYQGLNERYSNVENYTHKWNNKEAEDNLSKIQDRIEKNIQELRENMQKLKLGHTHQTDSNSIFGLSHSNLDLLFQHPTSLEQKSEHSLTMNLKNEKYSTISNTQRDFSLLRSSSSNSLLSGSSSTLSHLYDSFPKSFQPNVTTSSTSTTSFISSSVPPSSTHSSNLKDDLSLRLIPKPTYLTQSSRNNYSNTSFINSKPISDNSLFTKPLLEKSKSEMSLSLNTLNRDALFSELSPQLNFKKY